MTLEQIRAALPTHIMLRPGVHRWREGDEYRLTETVKLTLTGWQKVETRKIGIVLAGDSGIYGDWLLVPTVIGVDIRVSSNMYIGRRPIPPHILDNQAFYLLLNKGFESRDHFADKAENLGIVRKLGGLDNYRAQTKAGRLYDKWLLEQIESGG